MVSKIFILTSVILLLAIVIDGDNRIYGGQSAYEGQFPYQVSLQFAGNKSHHCGGSILNSKWILTAAHCVINLHESDGVIQAGATVLNYGGTYHNIAKFVIHEDYKPLSSIKNDIAVIELKDEIKFSSFTKKIDLEIEEIGEIDAVISGWGLNNDIEYPDNLQYLWVKTLTNQQCLRYLDNLVLPTEICARAEIGRGVCSADSGGPLVANGKQIGVVSWGYVPCGSRKPDVYVRVSSHIKWINNATNNVI